MANRPVSPNSANAAQRHLLRRTIKLDAADVARWNEPTQSMLERQR